MTPPYGYIKMSRKVFLPVELGGNKFWNEPRRFSRWEAWVDLIQLAAWQDHTRTSKGHTVEVPRGHVLASVRYLAGRWRWSKDAVARFVDELIRAASVSTASETPAGTLYRLVNYELYNSSATADETASATATGHRPGQQPDKEKKIKKSKNSLSVISGGQNDDDLPAETERRSAHRTTWLTPYVNVWREIYGGDPAKTDIGQLAANLKPLHDEHGEATVLPRLRRYFSETKPQFLNIARFASTFGAWAPVAPTSTQKRRTRPGYWEQAS